MKTRLVLLVISIFSFASLVPSLAVDNRIERYALVIGNAKYPDAEAPLREPINDARDVADELRRGGFDVEMGENLTGDSMRHAFERFYGRIKPGSVALVFFSGFGIQSSRQSYMIPIDAQIWTEADVRREGVSLEAVLGEINSRGAGAKIALIDASRRNPFERRFRSFSAGLSTVVAPNGTLVMYSAALSSMISDNGGDHSLFVQELLTAMRTPDLMAGETLNRTRAGVTRASHGEQVPWISSSLAEDFSFVPDTGGHPTGPVVAAIPPSPAPEPPPPLPRVDPPKPQPAEALISPSDGPADKNDGKADESAEVALANDPAIKTLTA
ncbi:MAG TPA: caspase family protein, partial [Bradyrhizobium sp.]|nr:caspase family protein [Bradyrhizobium sp.]